MLDQPNCLQLCWRVDVISWILIMLFVYICAYYLVVSQALRDMSKWASYVGIFDKCGDMWQMRDMSNNVYICYVIFCACFIVCVHVHTRLHTITLYILIVLV